MCHYIALWIMKAFRTKWKNIFFCPFSSSVRNIASDDQHMACNTCLCCEYECKELLMHFLLCLHSHLVKEYPSLLSSQQEVLALPLTLHIVTFLQFHWLQPSLLACSFCCDKQYCNCIFCCHVDLKEVEATKNNYPYPQLFLSASALFHVY